MSRRRVKGRDGGQEVSTAGRHWEDDVVAGGGTAGVSRPQPPQEALHGADPLQGRRQEQGESVRLDLSLSLTVSVFLRLLAHCLWLMFPRPLFTSSLSAPHSHTHTPFPHPPSAPLPCRPTFLTTCGPTKTLTAGLGLLASPVRSAQPSGRPLTSGCGRGCGGDVLVSCVLPVGAC